MHLPLNIVLFNDPLPLVAFGAALDIVVELAFVEIEEPSITDPDSLAVGAGAGAAVFPPSPPSVRVGEGLVVGSALRTGSKTAAAASWKQRHRHRRATNWHDRGSSILDGLAAQGPEPPCVHGFSIEEDGGRISD